MNRPVHYDLEAFEKKIRADFAKANEDAPENDFVRAQIMAAETTVQFGVFLARMDNEEIDDELQVNAAAAVIASLVENVASAFDGDHEEILEAVLRRVNGYARAGGETVAVTHAPATVGGRA